MINENGDFLLSFYNNNISIHKPILDIDRNNGEMHIKCSSINFSGYSNPQNVVLSAW